MWCEQYSISLQIIHKNVVDTSLLFPNGQEGRKNSLRFLSQKFLGNTIQDGGHDSTVDAQTALRLVKLKIKNGPNFGRQEEETESIFNRFAMSTHSHSLPRFLYVVRFTLFPCYLTIPRVTSDHMSLLNYLM